MKLKREGMLVRIDALNISINDPTELKKKQIIY